MRLFQATFMILTSYPILIAYLLPSSPLSVHMSTETTLLQLQGHLNVTRRWLRLVRFLEGLSASYALYVSSSRQPQQRTFDVWLDIVSGTCFGIFGMVETLTLLDLVPVDNLGIFGAEQAAWMDLEAQKFWFAGLYASAISTGFKLVRILAYKPVPQAGDFGAVGNGDAGSGEKENNNEKSTAEEEKEKLKKMAEQHKQDRKKWAEAVSEQTSALGWGLLADVLDLTIPSSSLGWLQLSDGTVATAMWCSSVITLPNVWKRVGRELDARAA